MALEGSALETVREKPALVLTPASAWCGLASASRGLADAARGLADTA